MKFRFIADQPTTRDALGFDGFVGRLYTALQGTNTPFVYGLLGPWGSGKTSVQQMLKARFERDLENPSQDSFLYIPIWLDAWKYENQDNMIYPLLYAFRQSRAKLVQDAESPGFGRALLDVVAASTLSLLDVGLRVVSKAATGEAIKLEDIKKHVESVEENKQGLDEVLSKWADSVDGLSEKYEQFISAFANEIAKQFGVVPGKVRFIVFVDDLDRCLPKVAVSVIENIKNHLCVPNCVYLLGINPLVIQRGIRSKYEGLDMSGREYLEKILNYSFSVPTPHPVKIEDYGSRQLASLVDFDNQNEQQYYQNAMAQFGKSLASCPFSNPRKINRILNSYLFFISAIDDKNSFLLTNIAKLIVLSEYYPDFFGVLSSDNDAISLTRQIMDGKKVIATFQDKYGLSIEGTLTDFTAMPGLLRFEQLAGTPYKDLEAHITAVAQMARQP